MRILALAAIVTPALAQQFGLIAHRASNPGGQSYPVKLNGDMLSLGGPGDHFVGAVDNGGQLAVVAPNGGYNGEYIGNELSSNRMALVNEAPNPSYGSSYYSISQGYLTYAGSPEFTAIPDGDAKVYHLIPGNQANIPGSFVVHLRTVSTTGANVALEARQAPEGASTVASGTGAIDTAAAATAAATAAPATGSDIIAPAPTSAAATPAPLDTGATQDSGLATILSTVYQSTEYYSTLTVFDTGAAAAPTAAPTGTDSPLPLQSPPIETSLAPLSPPSTPPANASGLPAGINTFPQTVPASEAPVPSEFITAGIESGAGSAAPTPTAAGEPAASMPADSMVPGASTGPNPLATGVSPSEPGSEIPPQVNGGAGLVAAKAMAGIALAIAALF
uniref:ARAD1B09306p n=1 Tax=Blastobotrys adeninivorans TaxID=409370 RepID=A0A060T5R0_BLAAD